MMNMSTSRFLASLDSARAAHPDQNLQEWWFPTQEQKQIALELGRSELMVRLLMGDTIGLSINQAFDSPVWFDAAQYIEKLKKPLISLALPAANPTLRTFIEQVAVRFFNPQLEKHDFLLSAWPNLDEKAREKIRKNLLTSYDFENMLKHVGPVPEYMSEQSIWLQKFLEYLERNKDKNIFHPAQIPNKSLWKRVADQSIQDVMGEKHFDQIPIRLEKIFKGNQEIRSKLINNRSALYKCIEDNDVETREKLRMVIDYHYNGMLAESVSEGRSSLSTLSLNQQVDVEEMKEQVELSDEQYDPAGMVNVFGLVGIEKVPFLGMEKLSITLEPLSWKAVFDVIASDEFAVSIAQMNSVPPNHPLKESVTEKHVDFLSQALGERLVGGDKFFPGIDKAIGIVIAGFGSSLLLYTLYFGLNLHQTSSLQGQFMEKLFDAGIGIESGLTGAMYAIRNPATSAAKKTLVGKIRKNLLKEDAHP